MYDNHISKDSRVANFRKEAKKLIQVHAKDVREKYPVGEQTDELYEKAMAQHRILFAVELKELFQNSLKNLDHLSEGFRQALEADLSVTFNNYMEYYKARY